MSLSSLLETDSELTGYLRTLVATPRLPSPTPALVAPPRSRNYGLVGTAFDYLLRWQLQRTNPAARARRWVAEAAIGRLPASQRPQATALLQWAKEQHSHFLDHGNLTEDLCVAAIGLAQLDTVFRSGQGLAEVGAPPLPQDIADLVALLAAVPASLARPLDRCLLNPTFGEASVAVGGADADLLLDDTLVDVKTTKIFKLERMAFDQLIGYVLLATLGGIDADPEPSKAITQVAIYFARYSSLVAWPLGRLLPETALRAAADWLHAHLSTLPPTRHLAIRR
jgi:hypothetical protein